MPTRHHLENTKPEATPVPAGPPLRVQLSRKKGWRLPAHTVVVARPTRWGNPFRITRPAERADVVARYRAWIRSPERRELRLEARRCLRGFNLACWCPLGGPCHADVLLRIANA
jgi:hypothetical protein